MAQLLGVRPCTRALPGNVTARCWLAGLPCGTLRIRVPSLRRPVRCTAGCAAVLCWLRMMPHVLAQGAAAAQFAHMHPNDAE